MQRNRHIPLNLYKCAERSLERPAHANRHPPSPLPPRCRVRLRLQPSLIVRQDLYKVGMIKILELREKAMNALGDNFNIKDFHSAVLDHGIPPLFIVEQKVDEMIEKALKS